VSGRYVVVSQAEALERGYIAADSDFALREDGWSSPVDLLVDVERREVVWRDRDGSSPEDMFLYRDLGAFVAELNRLEDEHELRREEAVSAAYDDGYDAGRDNGYDDGYDVGYQEGFDEGREDAAAD